MHAHVQTAFTCLLRYAHACVFCLCVCVEGRAFVRICAFVCESEGVRVRLKVCGYIGTCVSGDRKISCSILEPARKQASEQAGAGWWLVIREAASCTSAAARWSCGNVHASHAATQEKHVHCVTSGVAAGPPTDLNSSADISASTSTTMLFRSSRGLPVPCPSSSPCSSSRLCLPCEQA